MSTEEQYFLVADAVRSVVFSGNDGCVTLLYIRAPVEEIARFAALLAEEPAACLDSGMHPSPEAAIASTDPVRLRVGRAAWPAARKLLLLAWGIDIAAYPIALHTESKHTIDVYSPATRTLHELYTLAQADARLRPVVSLSEIIEYRRGGQQPTGEFVLGFDYYGWPRDVADGVAELLEANLARFGAAVAVDSALFAQERSDRLYIQAAEQEHLTWDSKQVIAAKAVLPTDRSAWTPRGAIDQQLVTGGDPALAAWPDHDIQLQAGLVHFSVPASLIKLIRLRRSALQRVKRTNQESERAIAQRRRHASAYAVLSVAELEQEQALLRDLRRHGEPTLSHRLLVEPTRGLAWQLSLGLNLDYRAHGLGHDWRLLAVLSRAKHIPEGLRGRALSAWAAQSDWQTDWPTERVGQLARRLDTALPHGPAEVQFENWLITARVVLRSRALASGGRPARAQGQARRGLASPVNLIVERWQPRVFAIDPTLAERMVERTIAELLAVRDLSGQRDNQRLARLSLLATTARQARFAVVHDARDGLSFRLTVEAATNPPFRFSVEAPVEIGPNEAPVLVLRKAQPAFIARYVTGHSVGLRSAILAWSGQADR